MDAQIELLVQRIEALPTPRAIGISGFGGAGKSTLAEALKPLVEPTAIVPPHRVGRLRAICRHDPRHRLQRGSGGRA